jgi:hypothetical protein
MKTTIDLPDALYQSARELAISENKPLSELIAALVIRAMAENGFESPDNGEFVDWRAELL